MPALSPGKHNTRQRKKLRLSEFQEFGFDVTAKSTKELAPAERQVFVDALIDAVVDRGLLFAGGFNVDLNGFVVVDTLRGSVTDEQRESLKAWMESRPELRNVVVGPLKDAWYSS